MSTLKLHVQSSREISSDAMPGLDLATHTHSIKFLIPLYYQIVKYFKQVINFSSSTVQKNLGQLLTNRLQKLFRHIPSEKLSHASCRNSV